MSKILVAAFAALVFVPASAAGQSALAFPASVVNFQVLSQAEWQRQHDEAQNHMSQGKRQKRLGMFLGGAGVAMLVVTSGNPGGYVMALPGMGLGGLLYMSGRSREAEGRRSIADLETRKPVAAPTTMLFDFGGHGVSVLSGQSASLGYTFEF